MAYCFSSFRRSNLETGWGYLREGTIPHRYIAFEGRLITLPTSKTSKSIPPPNHYKALPTYLLFLCLLVIGTLGSSGPNPTNLRQ